MGYGGGTAKYWFHLIGLKRDKKTHSVLTGISRKFNYNALKKFDKHEINLSWEIIVLLFYSFIGFVFVVVVRKLRIVAPCKSQIMGI